ncbi:MAG: head GIN domain-containing protein [Bacteroidia bacterium]
MKKFFAFVALFLAFHLSAQTEINIQPFTKIKIDRSADVELIQSNTHKLDFGNLKDFTHDIKNQTLSFDFTSGLKFTPKVKIYYVSIEEIIIDGLANITTAEGSEINSKNLILETDGKSKINARVDAENLKVICDGMSTIVISGKAKQADFNLDGLVDLNAEKLTTENVKVNAEGAGKFTVNAQNSLLAEVSGIVTGRYFGNPQNISVKVEGLSKLINAENNEEYTDKRNNTIAADTTKVKIGKRRFIITPDYEEIKKDKSKKEFKNVFAGFEVGMQALTSNLKTDLPDNYDFIETKLTRSWHYAIYFWEDDIHIFKNKLSLTSGFGLEFGHIGFDTDRRLIANSKFIQADSNNQALIRNRLSNMAFNIPLLIKYAPGTKNGRNKGFHIAAGIITSYVMDVSSYARSTANGFKQVWIENDDFNVNPFRSTATLRIGYGNIRLFANYNLTPYFKQSKTDLSGGNAPDFRIATVGLTLISF